jgi:hypothetical protein
MFAGSAPRLSKSRTWHSLPNVRQEPLAPVGHGQMEFWGAAARFLPHPTTFFEDDPGWFPCSIPPGGQDEQSTNRQLLTPAMD